MIPRVPLGACLAQWQADEEMADYFSAALNFKTRALKNTRLTNFPPFLLVQLNRCLPTPFPPPVSCTPSVPLSTSTQCQTLCYLHAQHAPPGLCSTLGQFRIAESSLDIILLHVSQIAGCWQI